MTLRGKSMCSAAIVALAPLPTGLAANEAAAQDKAPAMQDTLVEEAEISSDNAIVVTGERLRGQLDVEQAPVLELEEEDIQAVGANSVAELLAAIAPQTSSSRGRGGGGRPVILVNGVRISSFRELRSYPPEAIVKVEVLPEEVAQRFGFAPDRRVVNLILKENFASREVEVEYEGPSAGGYAAREAEFTMLRIDRDKRFNLTSEIRDTTMLTEAERGVLQETGSISDVAGDPDQALYRTLVPDGLEAEATLNWSRTSLETGSTFSLNGTYERSESRSLSGLNSVTLVDPVGNEVFRTFGAQTPLERDTASDTFSAASTYARPLGNFQLTATADASYADSETLIDRRFDTQVLIDAAAAGTLALDAALPQNADNGFDTAKTRTWAALGKLTIRGPLAYLPAGEISTTLDLGYEWDRIASSDTRSDTQARLTRGDLEAGLNVVLPITSRREGFMDALGSISLNGQMGVNHFSDFGTLNDWSLGLNWSPWRNLDLQATYVWREVAPSLGNLGNPRVETFNVPVFDFVNGETVLATVVSGGNPGLLAETQKDWKFTANWELPFWENTRLSAEYIRNRSSNVTSTFPVLTQEIEAAFPGRVSRDGDGRLIAIDQRPVTFDSTRSERLVLGLTTRGSFGAGARRGRGDPASGSASRRSEPSPGAPPGAAPRGGETAGGGPSPEQRARFMQFRTRICADDGMEVLTRFAEAVQRGEDLSEQFPGFDPERAGRMLERFIADDGTIDRERLGEFRTRICSFDPSTMAGSSQAGEGARRAPTPGARGGGGPRGMGFGGGPSGGRYFASLTHTIELDSTVLIAPGLEPLDLLDGDATSAQGLSRHSTRLETGLFKGGVGMRLSGVYTGKSRIEGSALPGSTDLFFGDLATIDLRVFFSLDRLFKKEDGLLKNFRVSFRADNVLDGRRRVVDANGDTPIGFQPALLDPTGRYLGIDLRKLF